MASDFTVERNSKKYVLGSSGYIEEYIDDAPAIEFNADGSYKGVLVEPAGTNEALQSEDLDNATYWNLIRTTIATDTETDPKGGTNSFLLSETVDNLSHSFVTASAQRPSIGSGETWTTSWFVKKGDGANAPDIIQITHFPTAFGTTYANFDISVGGGTSGTVTASSGGTGRIRYYGNGWYRISFTATSTSAGTDYAVLVFTNNNPTATRAPSYAGQTDANVFVWGAQLEEGSIATSYIPTTTGAVTRVKDDIYLTSASSLIGQTEGTLFVEVDWRFVSGKAQFLLSINDDSDNNRMIIFKQLDDELKMRAAVSGSNLFTTGQSATGYTGIQKIAFAYKTDDFELYRNGSSIATETSGSLASLATLTDVDFGLTSLGTAQANMWIRTVALFKTRLSATEALTLTGADLSDPYAPINGNEFTWNGLTYKVIVKNGLAWLDRNLGATQVATSSTDSNAYGDLYQWGRLTDGHEERNSGTTSTLSSTDVPGHGDFILAPNSPFDWRDPQNNSLWQGVNGINNPAPPGWRIPTEAEWNAERQSWNTDNSAGAFGSVLKLPVAGFRSSDDGSLYSVGSGGRYWSSSVGGTPARRLGFNSSVAGMSSSNRASGFSVRCVRDIP